MTESPSSNVAGSVSNGASSAYESITGSAQRVLPMASSLVAEATGFSALNESYSDNPNQTQQTAPSCSDRPEEARPSEDPSSNQEKAGIIARDDHEEEQERGPSKSDRTEQSQSHIGTETGIPTTGGAGSTLSPDDDVQAAVQKNGGSQAAVGVDYSDQPCPTGDARRDNPTSKPAEGKTQFDSREEQLNGSSESSSGVGSASRAQRSDSTAATSTGEKNEESGSKGASLKDKLKGQAKVLAGKVTRNEDKVEEGKVLKAGGSA